jgi:hypothetical protein
MVTWFAAVATREGVGAAGSWIASSLAGFFALDAPLLGQQRHGTHQVLHTHNAHHAAALGYGDQSQPVPRSEPADGGAEHIFRPRYLERARRLRLHVAVAVAAQCVNDTLARHDAGQLRVPMLTESRKAFDCGRMPAAIEYGRFGPIQSHGQIEDAVAGWQPIRLMLRSRVLGLYQKIE